ncbi:TraR/DksA C4-type zinc finger protein [Virgibacillus sp. 179-BFC.A HS]|uniref:TraR/DksA C4-type zinc finger protein n=1 Tax=Tigheibacillus jepli TaxID=3035914 RepID=A0ABU5CN92_9BACI|nr:TraR/DksA C4-type zinc finger protein [Virgibacillus sp. 179-BFC.A HS]MDY0406930.1 TraR/DksA C4-type zinc finger protein [Virgibacillus sp. 179-BFC.A HS]
MLNKQQLGQLKTDLVKRQNELIKQLQDHFGLKYEFAQESIGELSNYDNHPADHGTGLFERGKDLALDEHAEKELEKINEALSAIDEGTYGICSKCGRDIAFERLEAIPTTDRCREHAEVDQFKHARPIEEQVFSPNINPDEKTAETQVGYDAEDAWQDVSRYGTSDTPSDLYGDQDNYEETYPNSDEIVGSAMDVEEFLAADQHGNFTGVTPNHKRYEQAIDDEENQD